MEEKKVIKLEDRVPKLKEQKRRKANIRLILTIGFFFALMLFVIFFQSSFGKITNVTIEGNNYVSQKQLLKLTKLDKEPNYLNVSVEDLEKEVKKIDIIKKAKIEKKFPNKVVIKVVEQQTIAYLNKNDRLLPVLENGIILTTESATSLLNVPILYDFKQDDEYREFIQELGAVPTSILNSITEVYYTNGKKENSDLTLLMNNGYSVKITIHDFSKKISYYPSIIKQLDLKTKGTIHLDVGAYFEPNNKGKKEKLEQSSITTQ
ncbi:MAG: cell division protein FtsQ/DivIB [Bacillaceae bacterium]